MQAHSRPNFHIFFLLLAVVVLLLAFWLRLQKLDVYPPGLSNDEAVNAIDAFHFGRTGNFPLYEDPNRPEPLYRISQGIDSRLFGPSVWAFRLTSVLVGVLSVAAAYWATSESLAELPLPTRRIAGLAASGVLAVAIGHIALTRGLYRAVPQPLWMFLFAGFLLRGLRTGRRKYFVFGALSLAAAMYSYTAGLVLPGSFAFIGLSLLIFRLKSWRVWLPNMVIMGVVFAILIAPIGLLYLHDSTAVIGRASEVNQGGFNLSRRINAFIDQFFIAGDENPQYNAASAPLIPPGFANLFYLGLLALLIRIRQPSSALIAGFLILAAIPVIPTNEITHGLRIIGEYAAFPLIIGVGVGVLLTVLAYLPYRMLLFAGVVGVLAFLTLDDGAYARKTYDNYWTQDTYLWEIHHRKLHSGDWFYRPDRRDLALWILEQDSPLLVPVDELSWQTVHTWLLTKYPTVTTASDDVQIPENTVLVVPWSLEAGDLERDTCHFALLQDGKMILLPPLSDETHQALLDGIDESDPVIRSVGDVDLVARYKPVPADMVFVYEPQTVSGDPLLVFGNHELGLVGWRGPDVLTGKAGDELTYTLEWESFRRLGHEYSAFLQIQTQDYQSLIGDDIRILRWLYPTTVWKTGEIVPDIHRLTLPEDMQPGAYRLAVGLYPFVAPTEHLPVYTADGLSLGDSSMIGWLKVPQRETPTVDEKAFLVDATFAGSIVLHHASVSHLDDNHIRVMLYWESLVERPDFDATIFVHVVDDANEIVTQQDIRPWGGQYPTFIWSKGETVRTDHVLELSEDVSEDVRLTLGMYTFPGPDRLTVTRNGEDVPDKRIDLGTLGELLPGS
jgi:hypothetical protein